jgi:hypothetical protein
VKRGTVAANLVVHLTFFVMALTERAKGATRYGSIIHK